MAKSLLQRAASAGKPLAPATEGEGLLAAAMKGNTGQPLAGSPAIIGRSLAGHAREASPRLGMSLAEVAKRRDSD